MLHDFLHTIRIDRSRTKVARKSTPKATAGAIERGIAIEASMGLLRCRLSRYMLA
jgi:hypothetical protein